MKPSRRNLLKLTGVTAGSLLLSSRAPTAILAKGLPPFPLYKPSRR